MDKNLALAIQEVRLMEETNMSDELKFACKAGFLNAFPYGSEKFCTTINEARSNTDCQKYLGPEDRELLLTDIGTFGTFAGEQVLLDLPMLLESNEEVSIFDENCSKAADFQGKDVPLNQPMKGDVKKFKVFVRDPQSGNVKKVNFGLSVTRKLLENPERRAAFTARHNCPSKTDKTTPVYWACRTNRFFHKIFGGKPVGGVYW